MPFLIEKIQFWDDRTILSIIAKRRSSLTRWMIRLSRAGDGPLWIGMAILLYWVMDLERSWLILGISAFMIELSAYKVIKQLTTRQRPFHRCAGVTKLIEPPDQYSFPSGHSAAAVVAAFVFTVALPVLAPLFFLLAMLIGYSRIYLGVHYPSDVVMGFVLGIFSFASVFLF